MAQTKTVVECLVALGVTLESLQTCFSTAEEFKTIKKLYFEGALRNHPDKGGNADTFRVFQESWEFVRDLFDGGNVNVEGFRFYFTGGKDLKVAWCSRAELAHSYEWFAEAAHEEIPGYKVEHAKSARSECKVRKIFFFVCVGAAAATKEREDFYPDVVCRLAVARLSTLMP
jgi:hypothetical protein